MVGRAGLTALLEADFAGTNFGDTPDFTAITEHVRGSNTLLCTWGRQDWNGDVAAQLSLQLKNPNGDFTPGLSTGDYFPNVRRRNRIRYGWEIAYTGGLTFVDATDHWTVTASSGVVETVDHFEFTVGTWIDAGDHWEVDTTKTTLRFFDGYVNSWDAGYDDNVYPICDVVATDLLGRLSRATPLRPMFDEEILRDSPRGYYPLNDPGPTAGDITGTLPPLYAVGQVSWEVATGAVDDEVGGAYLPGAVELGWSAPVAAGCFAISLSTKAATGDLFVSTSGSRVSLVGGKIGTVPVNDGSPHRVEITGSTVQVDGLHATSWSGGPVKAIGRNLNAVLWGLAIWDTAPSSARLADHRAAIITGFAGETTAQRIARLLTYRPNFGSVLDPAEGKCGVQPTSGVSMQQALLAAGAVEAGIVYSDGIQQIVMRSRTRVFNPATTLSIDVSKVSGNTRFRDDIQGLLDDVTIARVGGATVRVIVPDIIEKDGQEATSLNLIVDTDQHAMQLAGWIAGNGAAEQVASPSLGIDLYRESDAAIVTAVLALQPLDIIELTGLPDTAPASTVRYVVQGGQVETSAQSAQVTLYTTALPLPVFEWDDADHGWDSGSVWAP